MHFRIYFLDHYNPSCDAWLRDSDFHYNDKLSILSHIVETFGPILITHVSPSACEA